ncbi:putative trehalose-6-phosphate synthase 2 [Aphelenchoides besseyi]|nr:putative trehalose-6-phosphate synthase 2 [Aphelenchoides besseyi]
MSSRFFRAFSFFGSVNLRMTVGSVATATTTTTSYELNGHYGGETQSTGRERDFDFPVARFSSLLDMTFHSNSVDEFKDLMYKMQAVRRHIVSSLLSSQTVKSDWIQLLKHTFNILNDDNTKDYQREMTTSSGEKFSVNIKDEIVGLEKDLKFLEELEHVQEQHIFTALEHVPLSEVLQPYHPISTEAFQKERDQCVEFLRNFVRSAIDEGRKPVMITDWDGTMKDYCSQYATNLQPIYSAVGMAKFAENFTRLTAVLTAGPLGSPNGTEDNTTESIGAVGPGILHLTALPIDGPVVFSGSWGREWWLRGQRVVHDDGISTEGIDALDRVNHEMRTLLSLGEYSQFGLVGSGVQRKVDRLTLGVQTVCKHVHPELSNRYQDEVKERMLRVDPNKEILHFDPSTELEVEIVVHNDGTIWNKANGVDRLIRTVGDTLEPPGRVLICGDTSSDLPMVQHAVEANPGGTMAMFVGIKPELHERVKQMVNNPKNCCFISCPDVFHAAVAQLLRDPKVGLGIVPSTQPSEPE